MKAKEKLNEVDKQYSMLSSSVDELYQVVAKQNLELQQFKKDDDAQLRLRALELAVSNKNFLSATLEEAKGYL